VTVSVEHERLLHAAYAAFDARDVDAALATMHPDVDWPNVIDGGRLLGRDAVRAYWNGQFASADPRVEPIGFRAHGEDRIAVDVHQVVRDRDGTLLSEGRVVHTYTLRDGLIERMEIGEPEQDTQLAQGARTTAASDPHTPHYRARSSWSGSTGAGYDAYVRNHTTTCPPADAPLALSGDPAFRGDPSRLNPEQLLVAAASSCQLLSFLAVAARARIDVTAYEDDAEGVMPMDDEPVRVTRIVLRPRIAIAGETPPDARLRRLVELAHEQCYIANSLRTEVVVEPTFVRAA
jgi:organic hydroperoxide reductase OsmC/OhrA